MYCLCNAREIIKLLNKAYGQSVRIYNSRIPFSVRAAEATALGVSIYYHDPKCKVADAYRELTGEVLING